MKTFDQIVEAKNEDPVLRREYERIKTKIRAAKAKGQDVSALETQRIDIYNKLVASRSGGAINTAPTPTPTSTPALTKPTPISTPAPTKPTPAKPTPAKPTPKPAGRGKDWDEGYKAAIEAIKQALSGQGQGGSGGQGDSDSGLEGVPMDPDDMNGGGGSQGQGSGEGSGYGSGRSRNGKQSGQGVVRPEDCVAPANGDLDKTPGTAGGMISKETGDKISEAEGYDKEGGNEEAVAKEWAERAKRAASQMAGKGEGYERLRGTLDGLYKATKDWKKELKKIVGASISPDDKRSAYANKNILISQDRIARTDKDKYDSMDYMVAAIDTSGSMTEEYLRQCLCEIYQIALAKKPLKLVILQFDTRIADIQEFTNLNDLKKNMHKYELKGGGGTDVRPVFDLLAKDRKYSRRPAELLMIFTDGYLEQYPRNMRTMKNLVWVIIDNLSFELKKKDAHTRVIRIKSSDIGN